MADAKLVVDVIVNSSKAKAGLTDAASGASKFQSAMGKMVAPAAAVLAGVGAFAVQAAKSASATQQAFGGLDAVFGSSAQQMKDWANTAGTSMGLSAAQYATGAAKIGAQLKNLGVPMDQVSGKTNELMQLGADLAATYGGTTAEAVDALSAALRGEADPAERYGLALGQTAIKAQMAADGTDKLTGAAASQAKAQAMLKLATEQSGGAIGQFARESDSAAGAAQIAAAQWENTKSALGEVLLPVLAQVATKLSGIAAFVQQNAQAFQILVGVIAGVAAAILLINAAMTVYQAVLMAVKIAQIAATAAQWAMNAAMYANPIGLVVLAIVALIAIIVLLWMKCEGFRNVVMTLWAGIQVAWAGIVAATTALAAFFVAAWNAMVGAIATFYARSVAWATGVIAYWTNVWTLIKSSAIVAWNALVALVQGIVQRIISFAMMIAQPYIFAFNLIKMLGQLVFQVLRIGFELIRAVAVAIANQIKSVWSAIFNAIKGAATAAFNAVVSAISRVLAPAMATANRAKAGFIAAWNTIKSAATAAFAAIVAAIQRIMAPAVATANRAKAAFVAGFNAIKSAATALGNAVRAVFTRMASTVGNIVNSIRSKVLSVFNALRAAASGLASALSAPFHAIASAVQGAISAVQRLINALSNIHVPAIKLPSLGGAKASVASTGGAGLLRTAPTTRVAATGRQGAGKAGAGGTVINVTGALDPDAVARQIATILSSARRRRSGVTLQRRAVGAGAIG